MAGVQGQQFLFKHHHKSERHRDHKQGHSVNELGLGDMPGRLEWS